MRCDGCGKSVSDEHIRERIARLELATRFRPIHIGVLLLSDVPPPLLNDYFYHPAKGPTERSEESQRLLTELMLGAEIPWECARGDEEAALAEFQHRGYFLAYCCECPPANSQRGEGNMSGGSRVNEEVREEVQRLGATVVRRIQFSYKPKKIALIGSATGEIIPLLELVGLKDRLILDDGHPFSDPALAGLVAQAEFRTSLGGQLRKVLAGVH